MNFSPHFHFNSLPEKEREREREKREPRSEREGRLRLAAPTSGAVHDRDRQSSGAIDDRRSHSADEHARLSSDDRAAHRSTSSVRPTSALVDRTARSTIAPLVGAVRRDRPSLSL